MSKLASKIAAGLIATAAITGLTAGPAMAATPATTTKTSAAATAAFTTKTVKAAPAPAIAPATVVVRYSLIKNYDAVWAAPTNYTGPINYYRVVKKDLTTGKSKDYGRSFTTRHIIGTDINDGGHTVTITVTAYGAGDKILTSSTTAPIVLK